MLSPRLFTPFPRFQFPRPSVLSISPGSLLPCRARLYTVDTAVNNEEPSPLRGHGGVIRREPYWYKIPIWKDVTETEFLDYSWQVKSAEQI
ncbi:hypothetical protein C8R41DRAFT_278849 [Lentinula lateritia]|uniref:Uncharacterized protein n=1 Tax=Lentinula lateritia TaxID=40482 RepID=A0ABQ8VX57_9AGAR|nr:hypothetical protein C8R41DRAFT_278849 [Lentinula lateritia]